MRRTKKLKIASLFKATSPDRVRTLFKVLSLHSQISKSIIFKQKPFIYKLLAHLSRRLIGELIVYQ